MNRLKQITNKVKTIASSAGLIILASCGGGSGGGGQTPTPPVVTIETGRFVDSAVAGLVYLSGDLEGITDDSGRFEYEVVDGQPQQVTFYFGAIEIGQAEGKPILTPLDLVQGGGTGNLEVQNIARFLQMLDTDGDLGNGISPSMDLVDDIAFTVWDQLDFNDPDFANQTALTELVSYINSVDSNQHVLPAVVDAQSHLEESLACLGSGIYAGSFEGGDRGQYVFLLQHRRADPALFGDAEPRAGVASVYVYSEIDDLLIGVQPQQSLSFEGDNSFIVGQLVNGAQFTGDLDNYTEINNGQWQNTIENISGSFSGARVAGDFSAKYRLAGAFGAANPFDADADNSGGIALDVFADDSVTGVAISTRGDQYQLEGTLVGEVINLTSTDGISVSITFDPDGTHPLNSAFGFYGVSGFWGEWQLGGDSGGVGGTSCLLNPVDTI